MKPLLRQLSRRHYGGIHDKVQDAHDRLIQLQEIALKQPSATSFEAFTLQEALLADLTAVEESFLKQKSRINWLNEGDLNTNFFHRVIKGRQSKMGISSLIKVDGTIISTAVEFITEFVTFFQKFLGSTDNACTGGSDELFHSPHLSSLSTSMQDDIVKEVTDEEIANIVKKCLVINLQARMGILLNFSLQHGTLYGLCLLLMLRSFLLQGSY